MDNKLNRGLIVEAPPCLGIATRDWEVILTSALFQPFQVGSATLKNRIVMAPMTRSFSPGGIPGTDVEAYYLRRAQGGVGMIVTEGVAIDRPASVSSAHIPRFHGDAALARWQIIVDACRNEGCPMVPQLWHMGAVPRADHYSGEIPAASESPSGIFSSDVKHGNAMQVPDIEATIEAFAAGAASAQALGFAAVEFHGAHGYLFDQFFWDVCNKRSDRWGGATLEHRTTFAVEAVKAARAVVGPDFPIILRISQWKQQDYSVRLAQDPVQLERWLRPLVDAGVSIFDCSQRRFWIDEFEGDDRNLAGWVKKVTGKPTITVGSVGLETEFMSSFKSRDTISVDISRLDELARRLERGDFDLVAVGRALLADPAWVNKVCREDYLDIAEYSLANREVLF